MRIFYASENGPIPGSRLWYNNLYLPLVDLGHEMVRFDFPIDEYNARAAGGRAAQRRFINRNRPRLEATLLSQLREAHEAKPVEVFFSYFYDHHCRPEVITQIRQMGILTLNWYCNASYQFDLVSNIAPAYDFCLVPEKFRMDDYRKIGARPIYTQEAANPNFYKPYELPREYDVVFVGQMYGDRPHYIRALLDAEIAVRVWGVGWPARRPGFGGLLRRTPVGQVARAIKDRIKPGRRRLSVPYIPPEICGPPLSDDEMVRMYSRCKISLGFSSVGETHRDEEPIKQVRLRDFEAPMSGAFYMVECQDELGDFFDTGSEIVCYQDKFDLVDKVRYFLSHDEERERIRRAGHGRALHDHSWQMRLGSVLEYAVSNRSALNKRA